MEKISIERIIHIISYLYKTNGEVVVDYGLGQCYLFLNMYSDHLDITWDEADFLVDSDIVDLDSGCDEPEHETKIFKLSDQAIYKIQNLIRNRKQKNLLET